MNPIVWTEIFSVVAVLIAIAMTIGNMTATKGWLRIGWLIAGVAGVLAIVALAAGAVSQWH